MDLDGVHTFVVAARLGQFQAAADELGLTPQAVSKRIGTLERDLATVLFVRNARGVALTRDGRAFLGQARDLLGAAERARRAVEPDSRELRVDVTNLRIAPSVMLHRFHLAHPDVEVEAVTLPQNNLASALAAVQSGSVDASFRAVPVPPGGMPDGVSVARVIDDALEVLVGPDHALAAETSIEPYRLTGYRIWIPGIVADTEWARFYEDLAAGFGLSIDARGPHFGDEALLERLRKSAGLATLVGHRDRYLWPERYNLRRIPLRNPTPVYPHSLIWLTANRHPGLSSLRRYLAAARRAQPPDLEVWTPRWAATDAHGLAM